MEETQKEERQTSGLIGIVEDPMCLTMYMTGVLNCCHILCLLNWTVDPVRLMPGLA